ncbi:MAG: 1-acyl-sn-glycerol-3-phosphate acyltransferase [Caldilineaceae bacterium]
MSQLLGAARIFIIIIVITLGLMLVLLANLLPMRYRGSRLSAWIATGLARIFAVVFNVRYRCNQPEKLKRHQGFIFSNHVSYLEPIVLFCLMPVRFLAAIEVQRRPIVGQLAEGVGTIFVERAKRESRQDARNAIADALHREPQPPLALFPEGKLGPGIKLNPFRYGAFEIAAANSIAYLPCAIRYTNLDVVVWYGGSGESLMAALWRLAVFPGPVHAEIIPLDTVQPTPQDDPTQLAQAAERMIARELGFEVIESGGVEE